MKVLKRSGKVQNFDLGKIKTSIARASDDANEPLNRSDIDLVAEGALKHLEAMEKEIVTSENVFEFVLLELEKCRFYHVAKAFREGTNR